MSPSTRTVAPPDRPTRPTPAAERSRRLRAADPDRAARMHAAGCDPDLGAEGELAARTDPAWSAALALLSRRFG